MTISASDHYVTIWISKDGGNNWGAPTIHDIGATGEFLKYATRLRVGQGREIMVRWAVTSPRGATVIAAEADIENEAG